MNCTALGWAAMHCGAMRCDAMRCDATGPQLRPTKSRCLSPGAFQPDSANLESSALRSFGEVRPSPIKPLPVLWALIVVPCGWQQYDRPTWWRQCHLDVNWQTRSRNRNFGQDEWQTSAQVQRCAVRAHRAKPLCVASISKRPKRTRCADKASLWDVWPCTKNVPCDRRDESIQHTVTARKHLLTYNCLYEPCVVWYL